MPESGTPAPCCAGAIDRQGSSPVPVVAVTSGRRSTRGQVRIPAGTFVMGDAFAEGYAADGELPQHEITLPDFWIDECAVTNVQFGAFVRDTGHVTTAERFGSSAVFEQAVHADAGDILGRVQGAPWWIVLNRATWRRPDGPTGPAAKSNHPVVHVSWDDAQAFCAWAGKRLPSEAEWEYAARGGLAENRYAWGDELTTRGRWRCNIWQGHFPVSNTIEDGYVTTAPVKTYRPNGYGLWNMSGNAWEWCQDWFDPAYYGRSPSHAPTGPATGVSRVMRGGSYLCHESYCHRYRVSARSSNTPDSSSANLGFRCANDA